MTSPEDRHDILPRLCHDEVGASRDVIDAAALSFSPSASPAHFLHGARRPVQQLHPAIVVMTAIPFPSPAPCSPSFSPQFHQSLQFDRHRFLMGSR